jgi:peptidoglycan/xylan/chitin deacetylase (PgdA/CDA1 family)
MGGVKLTTTLQDHFLKGITKTQLHIYSWELGKPSYLSFSQLDSLYSLGWEFGTLGNYHIDMSTISNDSIISEIRIAHDTLQAHGYRHRRLFGYPYGVHNRNTDTLAMKYTDVRRSVTGLFAIPGNNGTGVYLPMGSAKYITHGGVIQYDTTITGRWPTVKKLIDSCVTLKVVSGIIMHGFRASSDPIGGAVMDTATLYSKLFYLDI